LFAAHTARLPSKKAATPAPLIGRLGRPGRSNSCRQLEFGLVAMDSDSDRVSTDSGCTCSAGGSEPALAASCATEAMAGVSGGRTGATGAGAVFGGTTIFGEEDFGFGRLIMTVSVNRL